MPDALSSTACLTAAARSAGFKFPRVFSQNMQFNDFLEVPKANPTGKSLGGVRKKRAGFISVIAISGEM